VRKGLIVVFALVLLGLGGRTGSSMAADLVEDSTISAPVSPAVARPSPFAGERGADFFPVASATYSSTEKACGAPRVVSTEPERPVCLARPAGGPLSQPVMEGDETVRSGRRRYLPVVLSLLVPGTGEIYMGYYVRGAVLIGAEVAAWTGYLHYHNKGLDSRADYERFADEHWTFDKWVNDNALWSDPEYTDVSPRTFEALDSIGSNYWEGWPPYHTWHPKETEKQNYYENIGKYDWFISGWEDWDPVTQPRDTALRTTYRAMRKKSNDELDKATGFIYLSIAARVASLVETVLLSRRDESGASRDAPSQGFSVDVRATGIASGEVALVYRFR
jgi:hypothetical protein